VNIIANKDIDEDMLQKITVLEHDVFGDEQSVDPVTYRKMHAKRDAGIFCLVDDGGEPIGFADAIFITDEQKEEYLRDGNFRILKNIGARVGDDNILYLFGLALRKDYRSTGVVLRIAKCFAKWLGELDESGVKVKFTFTETISADGVRFAKAMGMHPMDEQGLKPDGSGFYYSPDNLAKFVKRFA